MSSRQLEEQQELARDAWVAKALGMTAGELSELEWDLHEIDGNDGAVYGYRVELGSDTDPAIITRLGGDSVDIGFPPDEPEPDYPS